MQAHSGVPTVPPHTALPTLRDSTRCGWSSPCPVRDASHLPTVPSSTLAELEAPQYSHGVGCVQHPLPQLINDTVHPITSETLDTFI